ncbi:synaptotagmin-5 [Chrysoperla carnea]|uniref:synaptotagmin-5 n=1 Tax=Chrysoperla carnea TaxID=189513 RepID=UPI001D071457|nr:synaptotagmin-5 [Chrysoperla carnea]
MSKTSTTATTNAGGTTNSNSLGPAGCWVTHKRLESWARVAKERAISYTSPIIIRNGGSSRDTGSTNSLAEELNNDNSTSSTSNSPHHSTNSTSSSTHTSFAMELMRGVVSSTLEQNSMSSMPTSSGPPLQHQSKSYPSGCQPRLVRTPSVSSQGSFDGNFSRQSHRGSSPQIRTYGPDGRTQSTAHATNFQPSSRSPSPHRTVSLDIRCTSPGSSNGGPGSGGGGDFRGCMSPSQTSLVSLTGSQGSTPPQSSSSRGSVGRCLSPLLIPQKHYSMDCGPLPPASPLGALQPDLYNKRDGPLFLNNPSRSGPTMGRLHLRLKYDFDRSDLAVHLIEAHDLSTSDQGGFNDPYVRVSMSPCVDNRKRQTTIHRNNPNPFFDQQFKFPVSHEDLQDKTLILQVFDGDRFSRNDVAGEVRMSMEDLDVTSSIEVWGEVTKTKKPPEEMQEVLLSLSYLPSAERLTVVVIKARNLFIPEDKESVDPFVKVNLIVNGKRVKKKKTASRKFTSDPVWNEAMTFSISSSNLNQAAIEICVMDQNTEFIGSNPLLGCCLIGSREEGPERAHWLDMIQSPRKAVSQWHILR